MNNRKTSSKHLIHRKQCHKSINKCIIYSAHVLMARWSGRVAELQTRTERNELESFAANNWAVWLSWIFNGNCFEKKNATCVVRKQEIIITIVDNVNSLQCDRAAFCLPRATPRIFPRLAHTARTKPFHASNALELALISRFFLCLHARPKAIKKKSFFHCFRIAQCRWSKIRKQTPQLCEETSLHANVMKMFWTIVTH